MVTSKAKRVKANILSHGENRLLKKALRRLLGPGLVQIQPRGAEREEKANFLRDALNFKILEAEWLA